jgi:hypothetical protein
MKRQWTEIGLSGAVGLLAALGLLGCGGAASPVGPTVVPTENETTSGTPPASTVSAELLEVMELLLQDEYHAEAVYRRVILDFGEIRPFVNIAPSEAQHAANVAKLYTDRELEVPANEWNVDNVPRFDSVRDACAAAVEGEIANMDPYDAALARDLPADMREAFQRNRDASLNNHLPAFRRCS